MKKSLFLISVAILLVTGACSKSANNTETDSVVTVVNDTDTIAADTVDTVTVADTVQQIANIPFEVKKMKKKKGENELEIEYPVKGNEALVKSVRTWISQQLGESYKGNFNNAEAFFNHYVSKLGDEEMEEFGGFTTDKFELEFTNDYIVTYEHSSYEYQGGAHGDGGESGTTFLQSDGSIFSKKCFTSYNALHSLFVNGLKEYFKVKTDAQLLQNINESSIASISPPGMEPWIDKDGVVFSYSSYEIAPYSAGQPRFTIPYAKLEPYLTEEGKKFFGK